MPGQVSKEKLGGVVMQAMQAQKNIRPQRDRLLQLRRRLKQQRSPDGDEDAASLKELTAELFKVHFMGIEVGARMLGGCIQQALKGGARICFNIALGVIPDEQQYDVLLAHRLPARPTTQAEAFSRLEAAFNTVKLAQEHHLSRCIELLAGVKPPSHTGQLPRVMISYPDDKVAAATEHIAKNGLPIPAKPARAAAAATADTGKEPHVASSKDLEQALTYLHRACSLLSLAVKHMDIAVAVLSSFLDPKKVASLSDFTDKTVSSNSLRLIDCLTRSTEDVKE